MDPRGGRSRAPRRRIDGVLLLDKPAGLTSNAALQRAKRALAAEKAGHTGTLDPLATGLLPLCFGEATKFAQAVLEAPKEYVATVRFGAATTTGDAEGETVRTCDAGFARAEVERVLARFVGPIVQTPPAYAALKFRGRSYYEYARAGLDVPRVPRAIEISAIELIDWSPPLAVLRVACSKGTYLRVLAEDIAGALGSCAHLAALRRTASGSFNLADAVTLETLEAMDDAAREGLLLPSDAPLSGLARLDVDASTARDLAAGRVGRGPPGLSGMRRCYGPQGRFLGLVEGLAGELRAVRLARTDDNPWAPARRVPRGASRTPD
jgi:tRNA pseudouridine55 synthase